jgi:glycosyltransferase involved in cell wall biosynthesis
MKNTLVSVCITTYNHEKYIEQCLDSILNQQTNFQFEIVLGEDDSTDSTRVICKQYAAKYPDKIRLFLRSRGDVIFINGKPTGRFNFIENLKSARGKYIALCEGDDYWTDPLKLQNQVDYLESNESFTGSFHDSLTINETHENRVLKPFRVYDKNIFELEDTISTTALFHTSSFVFRVSLLYLPSWFVKVQSADMALFAIIASKGPLYRIDATMSVYRKNIGGITNSITVKNYHKNRIRLFKYLKSFCSSDFKTNIDQVINFHKSELKIIFQSSIKNRIKRFLKF